MRGWAGAVALVTTAAAGPVASPVWGNENHPPVCSGAAASPADLWPPNHEFVAVAVRGVTDPDGDPVSIVITAIAQDEPLGSGGSGHTCPDAIGVGTATAHLRVERDGQGDGRVYHVSFRADDGRGRECTGTVAACVRHDQRPGGACGDQGARVDSTAGAPRACDEEDCDPRPCVPSDDELAGGGCQGERPPPSVERHLRRARALLGRAERAGGRAARRLRRRAVRQLREAARAARHGTSPRCAAALARRLDDAVACMMCAEEDD